MRCRNGSANAPTPSVAAPAMFSCSNSLCVLKMISGTFARQVVLQVGADLLIRALGVAGDALEMLLDRRVVVRSRSDRSCRCATGTCRSGCGSCRSTAPSRSEPRRGSRDRNARATSAATRRVVSGTRARISSTSKRTTVGTGTGCDLTVDSDAPANAVLGICARIPGGVVLWRTRPPTPLGDRRLYWSCLRVAVWRPSIAYRARQPRGLPAEAPMSSAGARRLRNKCRPPRVYP